MYIGSIVHPNQGVPILIEALPRVFDAVPGGPVCPGRWTGRSRDAYQAQLGAYGDRLIVLTSQTPEQVVALSAAPMSWFTRGWPAAKTTPYKARSPSISPPAARSWRLISAIIKPCWAATGRVF